MTVQVPPDSTGKVIDTASLNVGGITAERQRVVIGDNSATAQFALVTAGALTITGNINVSATAIVAFGTPQVLNNISATVVVAGVVGLTAGTAVIGDLNAISRTVQVAIATPFTVNNISATVIAVLAAGTANIGTLNDISRTVAAAIATASFVTIRPLIGSLGDPSAGSALTVKTAFGAPAAASVTLVTAVVARSIRVLAYRIQAQGTVTVNFGAGSSGAQLSQKWTLQAREGTVVNAPPGCFEFQSSAGEGITVQLSAAVTADVSVVYVEI